MNELPPPNPIPVDGIPLGTPRVPKPATEVDLEANLPPPAVQQRTIWGLILRFIALLTCSTNNRIEPMNADTPGTPKPQSTSKCCSFLTYFCRSDEHLVNDKYHDHPSRRIPRNEKKPEVGHEFDEWFLGEARAMELVIDDSNALEHGEKLVRVLHAYDCIQKIKGNIEYMLTGDPEVTPVYDCTKRYCDGVRSDLLNLVKCRAYCENPECDRLLTLIKHWRECTNETCPVCAPCRAVPLPQPVAETPKHDPPLTINMVLCPVDAKDSIFNGFIGNAFPHYNKKTKPPVDWHLHLPDGIREHLWEQIFYDWFLENNMEVGIDHKGIISRIEEEAYEKSATREEYYARIVLIVHNLRNPDTHYKHYQNSWQRHIQVETRDEEIIKLFNILNQDPFPPENNESWLSALLEYARGIEAGKFWNAKNYDKYVKEMKDYCRGMHMHNQIWPMFL